MLPSKVPTSAGLPLPLRPLLPARYRQAVPPKMRRNFRNRKIASVPVKGPAFSDPKGTSRPKRIVPRQSRVTRRSIIDGLRPRQLRFA